MNASDAKLDQEQLAALSRRLHVPVRQLLIAAARLAQAEPQLAKDPAFRARVLREAKHASAAAAESAALLLTPLSDYAINELDSLFAGIWPADSRRDG